MKRPQAPGREMYELLVVIPAALAALALLPIYRALPVAIGLPALWLWFCLSRWKWRAAETTPPSWVAHRDRMRGEFRLAIGLVVLLTVALGFPWGTPIGSGVIFTGVSVWWNRSGKRLQAARGEWFAAQAPPPTEPVTEPGPEPGRVRPTHGHLTRASGEVIDVRWIETGTPGTFLPVTVDGDPIVGQHGDRVTADVVAPGQALMLPSWGEVRRPE